MDYDCTITMHKALTQVIVHAEVCRPYNTITGKVIVWQYTDLLPEEAHPEPQKWLVAHLMQWLETMP